MLDRRVLQHGEPHRHADSVVRSQGSPVRRHPLSVDVSFDRIFQEIMVRVGGLLRDHVHMALQDHAFPVFKARSCADADNDVAGVVLHGLKSMGNAPVIEIINDFTLVLGGTGNPGQSIEILPDDLGVQFINFHILTVLFVGKGILHVTAELVDRQAGQEEQVRPVHQAHRTDGGNAVMDETGLGTDLSGRDFRLGDRGPVEFQIEGTAGEIVSVHEAFALGQAERRVALADGVTSKEACC